MICKACREAGFWTPLSMRDAAGDIGLDDVKEMHAKCPGGTWCDCQHKTESVVRKK